MEAPPTYYGSQPQKNKTGLIIGLIIGAIFLCCVGPILLLGGLGIWGFSKGRDLVECSMAFGNVRQAVLDYADAHDGKLPPAATWQDAVKPFYEKVVARQKDMGPFHTMSADGEWGCSTDDNQHTGMAYNTEVASKKREELRDAASTVLLFEVPEPRTNLSEKYKAQDTSASPKIMGKNRGWFVAPVSGMVTMEKNGVRTQFEVSSGGQVSTGP